MRAISRSLGAGILVLSLGAGLAAPALADQHTLGDQAFEKALELGRAERALQEATEARKPLDAAAQARQQAASRVKNASNELERATKARKDLPRNSSTTEKLQKQSDVDAAKNKVNEAERDLREATSTADEAGKQYREERPEAESLETIENRVKRLRQELAELHARRAKEEKSTAGEGPGSPGAQITVTAPGGDAGTSALNPFAAGVIQRIAQAAAQGRSALDAMAAALRACNRAEFEAARQRVQSALVSLAHGADLAILGPQRASLQGLGHLAHGAMNEVAGLWKPLEQLWALRCGAGAMCAAPRTAAAGGGFTRTPIPPPPPPPINPRPKDPDGQPDPGGPPGGGPGSQPPCPDTPELAYYRSWLSETQERIRGREEALNDPDAGTATKETAARQLEQMTRERDDLNVRINDLEDRECERQRLLAKEQAEQDARFQAQLQAPSPGEEYDRSMKLRQLQSLKDAVQVLQTRAQQMQDTLAGLQQRIATIDQEIAGLRGRIDEVDRLRQLVAIRNGLAQSLQRRQQAFAAEVAQLIANYQFHLWIVSPEAFRASEIRRLDEYRAKRDQLVRTREIRQLSDAAFQKKFEELKREIAEAETAGDSARADERRRQLENMAAGEQDWKQFYEMKEARLTRELEDLQIRNGGDGVGPGLGGDQAFREMWAKYDMPGDPFGPVVTDEDRTYITQTVYRYADGARGRQPDDSRSIVVQFGEELLKETGRTIVDQRYATRKALTYGEGVVVGTVEGIVDIGKLAHGVGAVLGESAALALGAEGDTPALDTLNAVLDQATPSGLVQATIAAGKVVDDIAKRGDIGAVGRGVGMVLGPDVALGTVKMVAGLRRAEEAAQAAAAADKVSDTATVGSRAGSTGAKATDAGVDAGKARAGGAAEGTGPRAPPDGATPALAPPRTPPRDVDRFAGARSTIDLKGQDGPAQEMVLGNELGRGRDAHVYDVNGNPAVVAKVYPQVTEGQLALLLRQGSFDEVQRLPSTGAIEGAELLGKLPASDGVAFTKLLGIGRLDDGKMVLLFERIPANAVIVRFGAKLTAEQRVALKELFEAARRNGLFLGDAHIENIYFFTDKSGKLRAGLLDTDRVFTLAEANGHPILKGVAEGMKQEILKPETAALKWGQGPEKAKLLEMLESGTAADFLDAYAVRMGYIGVDPSTGRFVNGLMSVEDWAKMNAGGAVAAQTPLPSVAAGTAATGSGATATGNGTAAGLGGALNRDVPLTGAGLAGLAYHLFGHGPFTEMTKRHLMCWSRLYFPILTPLGLWFIPFETYDPGFFQGAAADKDDEVSFVEEDKGIEGQRAGVVEVAR